MAPTQLDEAVSVLMNEATEKSKEILASIGATLVDITERTKELAGVVMAVRLGITRETRSKKTDKVVVVRDLDGRSGQYRQWYKDSFMPLVEEHIPESYKRGVLQAMQNHVQVLQKSEGKPSELEHLGLKATTKEDARREKKENERASEAAPLGDQIASDENAAAASLVEVAAVIARFTEMLDKRLTDEVENLAAGDKNSIAAFVNQAGISLANTSTTLAANKVPAAA